MRRIIRPLALLVPAALALGAAAPTLLREWKPYAFQGTERFEFLMIAHNHQGTEESVLILELDTSDEKSASGGELVKLSMTNQRLVEKSKLTGDGGFNALSMAGGMMPTFLFMNPMITAFVDQLELEVGEKMSLFGAGKVEVSAKETVAGVEGFLCKMYGPKEQEEPLQFEWVVSPDVALPLRTCTYQNGKPTHEMKLLSYEP